VQERAAVSSAAYSICTCGLHCHAQGRTPDLQDQASRCIPPQHRKRCKLQSTNLGNERPFCQKAERANIPEENTRGSRSLSQKLRKGRIPKKLASKSKKLELHCTNLMLNSKKTLSDCAKKPDPSISSGLYVKNKTIRVLLDSGSSGDLLFIKKGPVNAFPL
jgi:hypothetical protein